MSQPEGRLYRSFFHKTKRSQTEMMIDIIALLAEHGERLFTWILYGTNMTYEPARGFLARLVERGYITYNTKTRMFSATAAGIELVNHYEFVEKGLFGD